MSLRPSQAAIATTDEAEEVLVAASTVAIVVVVAKSIAVIAVVAVTVVAVVANNIAVVAVKKEKGLLAVEVAGSVIVASKMEGSQSRQRRSNIFY